MWRRLNSENLSAAGPEVQRVNDCIFVAVRGDGKCCVGRIDFWTNNHIRVVNGDYEVTLWFSEPRMFMLIEPPQFPEVRLGEPALKL